MTFDNGLTLFGPMTNSQIRDYVALMGRLPFGIMGGETEQDDDDSDEDEDDEGDSAKNAKKSYSSTEFDSAVQAKVRSLKKSMVASITKDVEKQLKDKAEREAAVASGDLQKIIDKQVKDLEGYEDAQKRLDVFESLSERRFEDFLESIPEAMKSFAPDEDADAIEKERWMVLKAQPALAAASKGRKPSKASTKDDNDDEEDDSEIKDRKRRGNNPWEPLPGGKNSKQTEAEILKGYEETGLYRSLF